MYIYFGFILRVLLESFKLFLCPSGKDNYVFGKYLVKTISCHGVEQLKRVHLRLCD